MKSKKTSPPPNRPLKKAFRWIGIILLVLLVAFIALIALVLQVQRTLPFDLPIDQNMRNNTKANSSVWMIDNRVYITSRGTGRSVFVERGIPPQEAIQTLGHRDDDR